MATRQIADDDSVPSTRVRSPNFPFFGLDQAVEGVKKLYERDRTAPTTREVAARHLGYEGLNGSAKRFLASLAQYGLIEDASQGKIRITARGLGIVHPKDAAEWSALLTEAYGSPRMFGLLIGQYGYSLPSDPTLTSQLVREYKFTSTAAKECIKSLRQGLNYIRSAGAENRSEEAELIDDSMAGQSANPKEAIGRGVQNPASNDRNGEQIEGRLSNRTRVELRISGPLGQKEQDKLKVWLHSVVLPWVDFMTDDEPDNPDAGDSR